MGLPTTNDVRDAAAGWDTNRVWAAEFALWLAQVKAEAWDEGRAAVREGDVCGNPACCPDPTANPYAVEVTR